MDRDELALSYHGKGFNCAQCVLASYGDLTELDEETALAVAGGFGGGLACGEVCGALSGAVMALSLANPHVKPYDPVGKQRVRSLAEEACERFRAEYGHLTCRKLVEMAGGKGMCEEFIAFGALLAEELIEDPE